MGLKEGVLQGIDDYGLDVPAPILQVSTDFLVHERDCLIRTTSDGNADRIALYCLSILQNIDTESEKIECQALILCPTGDVIEQVFECITTMGGALGVEGESSPPLPTPLKIHISIMIIPSTHHLFLYEVSYKTYTPILYSFWSG